MNPGILTEFGRHADRQPTRPALFAGDNEVSYESLHQQVQQLATALHEDGVTAGDRVVLLLENSVEFAVAYLAILSAGAVVVPCNPNAPAATVQRVVDDVVPAAAFVERCHVDSLLPSISAVHESVLVIYVAQDGHLTEEAPPATSGTTQDMRVERIADRLARVTSEDMPSLPDRGSLAEIIYTSGTTGRPKGVMLSHANLAAVAASGRELLQLNPSDRIGIVTSLFHLYGLREIDAALSAGAAVVLPSELKFPARMLDDLHAVRATGVSSVPSALTILLERYPTELASCASDLRFLTIGTAPSSDKLLAGLRANLPETRLIVTYGLTEASRVCWREVPRRPVDEKAGAIGRPYPDVQVRLLHPEDGIGRVAVRAESVMLGYWNDPPATAAVLTNDGDLLTPDYGRMDDDGTVSLVGRIDEVVNCGGQKVSPDEVEEALSQHPAVADVAAFGVADPAGILGQIVQAVVVPRHGITVPESELLQHASRLLEPHKVPRAIHFVDQIPKNVLGKPQRKQLARS